MAEWAYVPVYSYSLKKEGPVALVTEYEDLTESRRRKSNASRIVVVERHEVSSATMDAMLDFYDTKGTDVAFTKVTFNPQQAPATEGTFRFDRPIDFEWTASEHFRATIHFVQVL